MDPSCPHIRFCVNNPRSIDERNALLASGFECRDCLGNCDRCFEIRLLEIDGDFVEGDSYERIIGSSPGSLQKKPREDRGA